MVNDIDRFLEHNSREFRTEILDEGSVMQGWIASIRSRLNGVFVGREDRSYFDLIGVTNGYWDQPLLRILDSIDVEYEGDLVPISGVLALFFSQNEEGKNTVLMQAISHIGYEHAILTSSIQSSFSKWLKSPGEVKYVDEVFKGVDISDKNDLLAHLMQHCDFVSLQDPAKYFKKFNIYSSFTVPEEFEVLDDNYEWFVVEDVVNYISDRRNLRVNSHLREFVGVLKDHV